MSFSNNIFFNFFWKMRKIINIFNSYFYSSSSGTIVERKSFLS